MGGLKPDWIAGLVLASVLLFPGGVYANGDDWGPLFYKGENLQDGTVTRACGPIVESSQKSDGDSLFALRPFYSLYRTPERERWQCDLLWPAGVVRGFKQELSWRFLIAMGTDFDTTDPESRYRTWLLPIYFQGRDAEGEDYWAIFPLGGSVHEFLIQDRIDFFLFPLWMKHSINDIETENWLFPIIAKTKGPGVQGFRIFPFYGINEREGVHRKRFIMWPFWTEAHWLREGETGYGYILFPFWGHTSTELEETWYVLPPFFRFTSGCKRDLTYAPWPFYQRIKGNNLDRLYLWPIWGWTKRVGCSKTFYLWPLIWHEHSESAGSFIDRKMVLPFYYEFEQGGGGENRNPDSGSHYLKLWPLFSRSEANGDKQFRTLALWPGKNPDPVDRDWAPLWNLYWQKSNPNAFQGELLWGICRYQRRGERQKSFTLFPLFSWDRKNGDKSWSFLNGLAGFQKNGKNSTWRFLYIFEF